MFTPIVLPEMTLRSAVVDPPMVWPDVRIRTPLPFPAAEAPSEAVPIQFPATVAKCGPWITIPLPDQRLMMRPRITVSGALTTRPFAPAGASEAVNSTSGVPAKPVCVVASIVTGSVIAGSPAEAMVRTPSPGMANVIESGPCLALASRIACRSEPAPESCVVVTTNANGPEGVTVVDAVAELLAPSGSVPLADTVAVFDTDPAIVGVTTIDTVAFAPTASEPRLQVTVDVPVQDPLDAFADTNVTPAGRTSVTTAALPASGPLFETVIR